MKKLQRSEQAHFLALRAAWPLDFALAATLRTLVLQRKPAGRLYK